MIELVFNFFLNLADKFGVLEKVKDRLLGSPERADDQLVVAIEEIGKIYRLVENMLSTYLSLELDQASQQADRKALVSLEGGDLIPQVEAARSHCQKIAKLYNRYLRTWFGNVLDEAEQQKLEILFQELSVVDSQIIDHLHQVVKWLVEESKATLDLIDKNQHDAAKLRIKAARQKVLPLRRVLSQTMSKLFNLQADFIRTAK